MIAGYIGKIYLFMICVQKICSSAKAKAYTIGFLDIQKSFIFEILV